MSNTKISDLTALTGANAATTDVFPMVDVSDTTQGAGGSTKKMTRAEMFQNTPPIAVTGTLSASGLATLTGGALLPADGYLYGNSTGGPNYNRIRIYNAGTGDIDYYASFPTGSHKFYQGGSDTLVGTFSSTALTLGTGVNLVMAAATTMRLGGYTVATLPAAGTAGRTAYVTDATAPTYLGALTGGGAVVCPVFDNGVAWVSA